MSTSTKPSQPKSAAKPKTQPQTGQRALKVVPVPAEDVPEELIALRAYELWQRRGAPIGHDALSDWYTARAELERERASAAGSESRTK